MIEFLIPLLFIGGFVAIWTAVIKLLQRTSRMTDTVPASAGARLYASGWGNATVNGARGTNCIRVERYAEGHAVRLHPIFGGGRIWLPKHRVSIEDAGEHQIRLRTPEHEIVLSGKLRDFFHSASPASGTIGVRDASPDPTTLGPASEAQVGLAEPRRKGRLWVRLGLFLAVLLILYVLARRVAPDTIAPIDALLGR